MFVNLSFNFLLNSACVKDIVTVYLIHRTYKESYINGKISDHKRNIMKYFIFLTAFTLEDYGQVFLQFYYYERFQTRVKYLTLVNGIFMVLLSFKGMLDLATYSAERKSGLYE